MVIRRVGPLSCAKIAGVLYLIMGFVIGGMVSLLTLAGLFGGGEAQSGFMPALFGAAAVVLLPICYGFFGFVVTLVMTSLFNLVVGFTGGVEIDVS
jgi:hypothetical protein